jgi:hypothetical protein
VLLETIEQAEAKSIVIVPFKGIIRELAEEVGKHFACDIINGDVSKTQRDAIFTRIQDRPVAARAAVPPEGDGARAQPDRSRPHDLLRTSVQQQRSVAGDRALQPARADTQDDHHPARGLADGVGRSTRRWKSSRTNQTTMLDLYRNEIMATTTA